MGRENLGRCIWLPAAIPLTSTANETQFGTTFEAKTALDVIASLTNLTVSTAKLRDMSGQVIFGSEFLPILSFFGKRDSSRPAFYLPRAIPLPFGEQLELEVKNDAVAPEAAGHVVYIGIPREGPQAQIDDLERIGMPAGFSVNPTFTATAGESPTKQTPSLDHDFVIHGAFTDLASAQIRIQGVNGEQWMNDWTPVWAVAGRASAQQNVFLWPRKYLIPKGSTLTIDFKNVGTEAANLKLYFVGQKLNK